MGLGIQSAIAGEVRAWAGKWSGVAEPIPGWLVCNGAAYSTAARPELQKLYDEIGLLYGGTGATSFNLPDLTGRNPYGGDTTGSYANTTIPRSSSLTTATHAGIQADFPSHRHTGSMPSYVWPQHLFITAAETTDHNHQWAMEVVTVASGFDNPKYYIVTAGGSPVNVNTTTDSVNHTHSITFSSSSGSHSHTSTVPNVGSATAHENMPPFARVLFLIRY